ncbi:uncharacterized protein LOC144411898 [Styela clava]
METAYACIWFGSVCIVWFPLLPILLLLSLLCCWCCCFRRRKKSGPDVIEVQYETQEELEWSIFIQKWAARFIACAICRDSWNILGTEEEAKSIIFSDIFQAYFEEEFEKKNTIKWKDSGSGEDGSGVRRRNVAEKNEEGEIEGQNRNQACRNLKISKKMSF